MTKTLIIPDIHTGVARAEAIIDDQAHDNVVFIGDYFDAFNDTLEETKQVAEWLKKSLQEKNRLHLLGNHDLAYLNQNHMCSGFTQNKLSVIKDSGIDLTKLIHYCWVGDWLCTHAGLSNNFYKFNTRCPSEINKDEQVNVNSFLDDMEGSDIERFYDVSFLRGGTCKFGGILWCDYDEFNDIDNIKQIFGHTKSDEVRHKHNLVEDSEHYCIDTGLKNYGLYDSVTNEMIVKEAKNY